MPLRSSAYDSANADAGTLVSNEVRQSVKMADANKGENSRNTFVSKALHPNTKSVGFFYAFCRYL